MANLKTRGSNPCEFSGYPPCLFVGNVFNPVVTIQPTAEIISVGPTLIVCRTLKETAFLNLVYNWSHRGLLLGGGEPHKSVLNVTKIPYHYMDLDIEDFYRDNDKPKDSFIVCDDPDKGLWFCDRLFGIIKPGNLFFWFPTSLVI